MISQNLVLLAFRRPTLSQSARKDGPPACVFLFSCFIAPKRSLCRLSPFSTDAARWRGFCKNERPEWQFCDSNTFAKCAKGWANPPYNLSPCAAPSLDPSKRLEVPGEYWRPRRKPRAHELKIRKHADPSCVSRIVARR